jgi:tellurite methyltransferase
MQNDQSDSKWDKKYSICEEAGSPCWLLKNFCHLLPATGKSLDLACGLGANALHLAKHGLDSHGWDNSSVALAKLESFASIENLTVTTLLRNIEQHPPEKNSFDVIVVSHFLSRDIFPQLITSLKAGGLLFYQTFNQHKRSNFGPSNTDFLLSFNELPKRLAELELIYYREDGQNGDLSKGLRDCSYYIGRKKL